MRFEVVTAFLIGALLPVLETLRRGVDHWLLNFTTMFEDYLAGLLLLVAGWAFVAHRGVAPALLVLGWAYVTGMMGGSFWGQLEFTLRGETLEARNTLVVLVKGMLWSTCVLSLVLSFRRLVLEGPRHGSEARI